MSRWAARLRISAPEPVEILSRRADELGNTARLVVDRDVGVAAVVDAAGTPTALFSGGTLVVGAAACRSGYADLRVLADGRRGWAALDGT
jgi:hypothetical protein